MINEKIDFQKRGYTKDIAPLEPENRKWKPHNYTTMWLGDIHNIPGYIMIGGFFALGLTATQVFIIIMSSGLIVGTMMVLTGHAGSKYGAPFAILLRSSYGVKGAALPGFLRGCATAIVWFGVQCYAGSVAFTILITKFFPAYPSLGGDAIFLGISLPNLLSFLLMCAINVWLVMGGMNVVGRFFTYLAPMVYIVFGGMAIWSIHLAGGISNIISHVPTVVNNNNTFLVMFACVSSILGNWAAPILSAPDFTRNGNNIKKQSIGILIGLLASNLLFAFASISIIVGSEIAFGKPIWNILDVISQFDSTFAIAFATLTIGMTALALNVTANLIPASYQLATLCPKYLNFKRSVIVAASIAVMLMPWKLMSSSSNILLWLSMVGGLLGPVTGVMLAHYYIEKHRIINIDSLYTVKGDNGSYKNGYNKIAFIATIIPSAFCISGNFINQISYFYQFSWFIGTALAFVIYVCLIPMLKKDSSI